MLENYIKVYENAISEDLCNRLILFINTKENLSRNFEGDTDYYKFNEVILTEEMDSSLMDEVYTICERYKNQYLNECVLRYSPKYYSYEFVRIKKYDNNNLDKFGKHVDCYDPTSGQRFLAFLFYLNNVDKGGETEFFDTAKKIIKPKMGSLLIFPPTFLYPHIGHKPISSVKYIMSTYSHYAS